MMLLSIFALTVIGVTQEGPAINTNDIHRYERAASELRERVYQERSISLQKLGRRPPINQVKLYLSRKQKLSGAQLIEYSMTSDREIAQYLSSFGFNEDRLKRDFQSNKDPIGAMIRVVSGSASLLDWAMLSEFVGVVQTTNGINNDLADGFLSTLFARPIDPLCGRSNSEIRIRQSSGLMKNGLTKVVSSDLIMRQNQRYLVFLSKSRYGQISVEKGNSGKIAEDYYVVNGPAYRIDDDGKTTIVKGNGPNIIYKDIVLGLISTSCQTAGGE